jgi:peptide/nickel transport system substrate-binding protein
MKNKLFIIVFATALVLSACGGQGGTATETQATATSVSATEAPAATKAPTATEPATGPVIGGSGEIVPAEFSISKDILLDPALASNDDSKIVNNYLYEGLLQVVNEQTYLALAQSFTRSEDGLDYIFELRPGVKFHDGSAFNADAVVANFYRWFDPADPLHGTDKYDTWVADFLGFKGEKTETGAAKSTFDGAEKINDLTVVIHLSKPDPDLVVKLSNPAYAIVNPAVLKSPGFGTQAGMDGGTGAYMLVEWNDQGLVLQSFGNYWDTEYIPANGVSISFTK